MKLLTILYDGFVEYEYQIPILALYHQQIPFETAGLIGTHIKGMMGFETSLSQTVADIDPDHFTALFLPGLDRSVREQTLENRPLLDLIRTFDRAGHTVAAVCGGVVILGRAGVLTGRCFSSDVGDHPAFAGARRCPDSAIRDGHIITGLGARIFHCAALLLESLAGREPAENYRRWAGLI